MFGGAGVSESDSIKGDIDNHKRKKFLQAVGQDTVEDVIMHCSQTAKIDILLHAIDLECISVLRELLQAPQFLVSLCQSLFTHVELTLQIFKDVEDFKDFQRSLPILKIFKETSSYKTHLEKG